jgi:hypothetical protein
MGVTMIWPLARMARDSNSNLAPQDGDETATLGTQAKFALSGNEARADLIPNDSDGAIAWGNPQPVIPAKDFTPSMPIASQLTPPPQSSSSLGASAEASEAAAVQLALSDTHTASVEASKFIWPMSGKPVALSPEIVSTLEAFLHHTPSFYELVSASSIEYVDKNVSDAASPDYGVLTWDLSNGCTFSIVGIIPHHHHHAPATA